VGIFADLARLRPMMPFEQLSKLIGPEWQPSPGGWLSEGTRFAAHIDVEGKIGSLTFEERFPSTIPIDGLHLGMNLDDLLAAHQGFSIAATRAHPFLITDYTGRTDAGDDVTARVLQNGTVRSLEISRPGRNYPDGNRWQATQIDISPCSYRDPSEMLSDWAAGFSLTRDHAVFPALASWLMQESTPDDWHRFVPSWNWDYGIEPLLWIIQQKDCDRATALTAFYWTRPGQFLVERAKVQQYALDSFDLINEVRQRFLDGFYTRSSLAFDGARAFREEAYVDSTDDVEAVDRAIPEAMRAVIPGRVLPKAPDIDPWSFPPLNPRRTSTIVPPPITEAERLEVERVRQKAKTMGRPGPAKPMG
jgi:Domain of unknown function (DUF4274)